MNDSIEMFITKYNAIEQKDTKFMLETFTKYYGQTNTLIYGDYLVSRREYGIPQLDYDANRRMMQYNRELTVKLHKISTEYPKETICSYYCKHESSGDKKITMLCLIEDSIYKKYLKFLDERWIASGKPQMIDSISFIEWYNK